MTIFRGILVNLLKLAISGQIEINKFTSILLILEAEVEVLQRSLLS